LQKPLEKSKNRVTITAEVVLCPPERGLRFEAGKGRVWAETGISDAKTDFKQKIKIERGYNYG